MFSCPPATTMSASPLAIACAPSIAALRPEPHTLLIVIAGTMSGRPALIAAWRAGFWPMPAVSTWPMMTSETCSGVDAGALQHLADDVRAQVGGGTSWRACRRTCRSAVRAAPTMTIVFHGCSS